MLPQLKVQPRLRLNVSDLQNEVVPLIGHADQSGQGSVKRPAPYQLSWLRWWRLTKPEGQDRQSPER